MTKKISAPEVPITKHDGQKAMDIEPSQTLHCMNKKMKQSSILLTPFRFHIHN